MLYEENKLNIIKTLLDETGCVIALVEQVGDGDRDVAHRLTFVLWEVTSWLAGNVVYEVEENLNGWANILCGDRGE